MVSQRHWLLAVALIALACAVGSTPGCGGGTSTDYSVSLTYSTASLSLGGSTVVTATVTQDGAPAVGATVVFHSSDTEVATANPVQAVTNAAGQASSTIVAVGPGHSAIGAACGTNTSPSFTMSVL
jgi:hypothetical protein